MEIIIVTYNNEDTISKCLQSILNQKYKVKISIFDNNSSDNTIQEIKKFDYPFISYFKNINNIGFGKACNFLARKSDADIILFMNPDLELVSDGLLKAVEETFKDDIIKVIGVNHKDYNGISRTKGVIGNITHNVDRIHIKTNSNKCLYVSGGFLAIRNKDLKTINYFDEDYFMYWEDFDLCLKLHRLYKDCKIITLDNLIVKHKFQGSKLDFAKRMEYIRQSQIIFTEKWGGCGIYVN
ncbi:MAG TPA: glycosyltransferase family 2 protein [Bacteroidales bacterium]|nr:glycosyltransferase family 2 protein [Bacteroidales bacterium]